MKSSNPSWFVVTDFDGTLTEKDVGNELSELVLGSQFRDLYARYKKGEWDLRTYQQKVWNHFPLPEKSFREQSVKLGTLRPKVKQFLHLCTQHSIPVYVASCGLRPYIEPVLHHYLSPIELSCVKEIRCNEVVFNSQGISDFRQPIEKTPGPFPLDKGAWVLELRERHPGAKVLGLGNGTSDRTFWPHVDLLGATEGLQKWAEREKVPHFAFEDFAPLLKLPLFVS